MNNSIENDIVIINSSNYCDVTNYDNNIPYNISYINKLLGNVLEPITVIGKKKLLELEPHVETSDFRVGTMEEDNDNAKNIPRTDLGRKLLKSRKKIEAEGNDNLSLEAIEKEILLRRGGVYYEDF